MARQKRKGRRERVARRSRKRDNEEEEEDPGDEEQRAWHADLLPETKKGIIAVIFFIVAVLLVLSYAEKGGALGRVLFRTLNFLVGSGYFFMPLIFIIGGLALLRSEKRNIVTTTILGSVLFLLASLGLLNVLFGGNTGGFMGALISAPLLRLFDFWASLVIVAGLFVISLLLTLNIPLWKECAVSTDDDALDDELSEPEPELPVASEPGSDLGSSGPNQGGLPEYHEGVERDAPERGMVGSIPVEERIAPIMDDAAMMPIRKVAKKFSYKRPPLELLTGDRGKPTSGDIRANMNVIKRTLENFNIEVDMDEVHVGPTVTQYTLKPAEGVKLSRIVALHNNLSLALAAHPIRIEAPIPGKALIGIEVPNRAIATVGLRSLLENDAYQQFIQPLVVSLGRDVTGRPVYADIARMPHLLISGSTGAGKSVCVHSILTSLLYRNPPEVLRFILVDPKRVELSVYNDIPHLLTPVITDPKNTIRALRWATKEMDRRYDLLSAKGVRDITGYNSALAKSPDAELLPYIVTVIDELADLMATFPREVEAAIVRLAQMSRAVGIHLIVSTQRPSVEVITGLIKANITTRIAFQVASQIDSRTILDMQGAEKLLGNGDMLYLAGDSGKPRRLQGAFVTEQEVKRAVDFLREEMDGPEYEEAILAANTSGGSTGSGVDSDEDDPLIGEARELVFSAQKASASFLQRRLKVGYARAARLLDKMEEEGLIGPADGAKAREIYQRPESPVAEM